ncbi:MAG: AsnC family transcriptional regulator [Methanosphaera sp. rholeuAM74]|nr:MAG: AsnC family transcriptional regulator [Methanosphaera sp. rholeuAM74]
MDRIYDDKFKIKGSELSMDTLDKKILESLGNDGRKSYRKISRELDVSVGTIHNRVDKLIHTGIIKKFVPVLSNTKLGYCVTAIIGLEVKGGSVSYLTEDEKFNSHILALYEVTGQYDAMLIAKFKNNCELDKFIKLLLAEDDIVKTYTQTTLNIVKEELNSTISTFEQ